MLDVLGLPDSERQELMNGAAYVLVKSQRSEAAARLLGALTQRIAQCQPGSKIEDAVIEQVQQVLAATLPADDLAELMRRGGLMESSKIDALLTAELVTPAAAS